MTTQDEAKRMVKRRDQAVLMWQDEPNGYRFEAAEDATSRLVDALAAAIEYREAEREHDQDRITPLAIKLDEALSALREGHTHA